MNKLAELKAAHAKSLQDAQAILDKASAENREPSDEEFEQITGHQDAADATAEQVKAEEKRQAILARQRQGMASLSQGAQPRTVTATSSSNGTVISVELDNQAISSDMHDNSLDAPFYGFQTFGHMAGAVRNAAYNKVDDRLKVLSAAAGMNEGIDDEGAYLMPNIQRREIWDGVNARPDNLLAMTDSWGSIQGESMSMPANAETSRATGSRYGGGRGYWLGVGGAPTTSTPTVREIKLMPNRLGVLIHATNDLLNNASANLGQYIVKVATDEIVFLVSDSIIDGSGGGQPLGLLNANSTVSVAKETGQAATTIVVENIDKMYARLLPSALAGARWFYNVDCRPQINAIKQTIGTGGVPLFRPAGSVAGQPFDTLYGIPMQPIESAKTLGTVGDLILADLGFVASVTRGAVDSAVSMHFRFDTDEQSFRVLFRVDAQPYLASAITPFNGTNTLSPFVTLATRS